MACFVLGLVAVSVLLQHGSLVAGYYTPPVYPLASFNGSRVVNGTSRASGVAPSTGATCSDAFGGFPCSCLALSSSSRVSVYTSPQSLYTFSRPLYAFDASDEESITGSTTWSAGGDLVLTTTIFLNPNPPDACCEICTIDTSGVRILFWPVDDQSLADHNSSIAGTYTTVSNGFTFTSPSVYVAYDNLHANTQCDRLGRDWIYGSTINTTLAYRPEDLSTSHCFAGPSYVAINYTELQYPPPNSILPDCDYPGYEVLSTVYNDPKAPTFSPMFSYPPNVKELVPSWSLCNYWGLGAWDPPRTLNKETAMVSTTPLSVSATPAATLLPAHAPATPTPSSKDPQADQGPKDSSQSSDPKATFRLGSQLDPQHTGSYDVDPHSTSLNGKNPVINDPAKNQPSGSVPPIVTNPSGGESPSTNPPDNSQPSISSNGNPPNNDSPSNKDPPFENASSNDPTNHNGVIGNTTPENNNPSGNDTPNTGNIPNKIPSTYNPSSNVASAVPPMPPMNANPQNIPDQSPSSGAPENGNSVSSQGLGALIANAFGYGPSSTATPVNNPGSPNSDPEAVETMINSGSAPVVIGGSPVQEVSSGVVLVAGQTMHTGGYVTVSGAVVSVGSDSVAIDGTAHPLPALGAAIPTPAIVVGGNTAQRAPSGGLVIASQTLTVGAQATVAGEAVSIGSENAVVDGTTYFLVPTAPSPLALVIGGATTTLQPDAVNAAGTQVVEIGGQDETFSRASPAGQPSLQGVQPYIIAGQTLMPGGPAITVNGVSISLPTIQKSAAYLTTIVSKASSTQADDSKPMTVGNQIFTPNPSAFVIAGTTLSAGGTGVTIDGTTINLQPSGEALVVGSSTIALMEMSKGSKASAQSATADAGLTSGSSNLTSISSAQESRASGSNARIATATASPTSSDGSPLASAQATGFASSDASRRGKGVYWFYAMLGFAVAVVLACI